MFQNDSSTYYDILEIAPDASPTTIREAYIRAKSTYDTSNVALYTMISRTEREQILEKIEEAYNILSDPNKRKEYDGHHGVVQHQERPVVISIDRTPPMESISEGDRIFIPPAMDIPQAPPPAPQASIKISREKNHHKPSFSTAVSAAPHPATALEPPPAAAVEWTGAYLKQMREAQKISIEEMSGLTKISKNYLNAIEEERFSALPAEVYIRGFIVQICRALRLPHDKASASYLTRYQQSKVR